LTDIVRKRFLLELNPVNQKKKEKAGEVEKANWGKKKRD